MVQFLSINFFSWIYSIFVGFFKSSLFLCHPVLNSGVLRIGAAKLLLSLVYGVICLFTLNFIPKTSTRSVFVTALNSKGKYLLLTFKEKNAKLLLFKMLLAEERIRSVSVSFLCTNICSFTSSAVRL